MSTISITYAINCRTWVRQIAKAVPGTRDVHLVLDNYATHKTPEVKAWLAKHPRFKLHFTPTSASWLNLVERFFAEITARRIPPWQLFQRR